MSIVLALVDAPKHRVIASKTMLLTADGTDADQIEADTQSAARKLISADDEPAADAPRRPVMPAATVDDSGIVAKERKVAVPASTTETAAPASKEAVKKDTEKKKKETFTLSVALYRCGENCHFRIFGCALLPIVRQQLSYRCKTR